MLLMNVARRSAVSCQLPRSLRRCGFVALAASFSAAADPLDWPSWRGPEQNGISRETGLPGEWDFDGENLLWKSTELGHALDADRA